MVRRLAQTSPNALKTWGMQVWGTRNPTTPYEVAAQEVEDEVLGVATATELLADNAEVTETKLATQGVYNMNSTQTHMRERNLLGRFVLSDIRNRFLIVNNKNLGGVRLNWS